MCLADLPALHTVQLRLSGRHVGARNVYLISDVLVTRLNGLDSFKALWILLHYQSASVYTKNDNYHHYT